MRIEASEVIERTSIVDYIGQHVALRREGKELVGCCPFHKDDTPSFHVQADKRLWNCFGCGIGGDVIKFAERMYGESFPVALRRVAEFAGVAEGGSMPTKRVAVKSAPAVAAFADVPQRHVATYEYQSADGSYLFEVWRMEPGRNGRKKDFRQGYKDETGAMVWKKHPQPVLYRLPNVLASQEVFLVEGEKDVHTLERLGLVATTPPGGSNAGFDAGMVEALSGRTVYLVPDNDEPGEKRARQILGLLGTRATVHVLRVKCGKDMTDWAEAIGDEDLAEAIAQAKAELARESLKGLLDVAQILERSGMDIQTFSDVTKRRKGTETGFHSLDQMTMGMFPGDLIVVAGRPAMGKTSFAMNIAVNVAKRETPVNVFSLEMSGDQLLTRMVCAEASIDQQLFRHGMLSREDKKRFGLTLGALASYPIKIDDKAAVTSAYVREQIEGNPCGLVVIDYLGLMGAAKAENRVQQVGSITRGLKQMAKDLKLPVILVAQVSRAADTRPTGNNVPQLSDLRESGDIEQDADQVWFVYRPEYYKPDKEELRGLAQVIVAKQRNGPVGTAKLGWQGRFTKFVNLTNDRSEDEV